MVPLCISSEQLIQAVLCLWPDNSRDKRQKTGARSALIFHCFSWLQHHCYGGERCVRRVKWARVFKLKWASSYSSPRSNLCELSNSALRLCFPQGGQHQHSEQPAVQDGAVCQQPGEPGRGTNAGLPGGETKSRKPPVSNPAAVRDPNPSTCKKSLRVIPTNRESVTSVVKWHVLVLSLS